MKGPVFSGLPPDPSSLRLIRGIAPTSLTKLRMSNKASPSMKELTIQQSEAVKAWVNEGATLAEIQTRLSEEFGVTMTYMDVRFLIEDLNLELRDNRSGSAAPEPDSQVLGDDAGAILDDEPELIGGGKVTVDLDRVARAGAVVSGNVTFSDGQKAQWYLDQFGRLGLDPADSEYRPSPEDIQSFQKELQALLQQHGF